MERSITQQKFLRSKRKVRRAKIHQRYSQQARSIRPVPRRLCYRCAVVGHRVSECLMDLDSLICTQCEKRGHVAKICQAKRPGNKKTDDSEEPTERSSSEERSPEPKRSHPNTENVRVNPPVKGGRPIRYYIKSS